MQATQTAKTAADSRVCFIIRIIFPVVFYSNLTIKITERTINETLLGKRRIDDFCY
jgi:hypothetical protein